MTEDDGWFPSGTAFATLEHVTDHLMTRGCIRCRTTLNQYVLDALLDPVAHRWFSRMMKRYTIIRYHAHAAYRFGDTILSADLARLHKRSGKWYACRRNIITFSKEVNI